MCGFVRFSPRLLACVFALGFLCDAPAGWSFGLFKVAARQRRRGGHHAGAVADATAASGQQEHEEAKTETATEGAVGLERMDLRTYFHLFWLPAIVSAALMVILWTLGGLAQRAQASLAGWFLFAVAAQYLGTANSVWIVGVALQTALAVFLLLKYQVGEL
jgi:hypothetical protein